MSATSNAVSRADVAPGRTNAVEVVIPLKTPNMTNQREHHMARARRQKKQRDVTVLALKGNRNAQGFGTLGLFTLHPGDSRKPWVTVTLTRVSPGTLDAHDNLRSALKSVVDGVADWLGIDDASPRVEWRYAQTKGKAAVLIRLEVAS